jgi:O-antigen ligase
MGLVHPTSAGATASLGLTLLALTSVVWRQRRAGWLLAVGAPIHLALLLFAASRTAIGVTFLLLVLIACTMLPRIWQAAMAVVLSSLLALYLFADPAFVFGDSMRNTAFEYLTRNEPTEQLQSLTGRTDLWAAVWQEFLASPIQGCGYFVTSQTGMLDVWSGPANRTAHNVFLQVLASTGLVGFVLFLWGIVRPIRIAARTLTDSEDGRRLGRLLLLIGVWYACWGQLCASFMGPIQPESVAFFCCLGLVVSNADAPTDERAMAVTRLSHVATNTPS